MDLTQKLLELQFQQYIYHKNKAEMDFKVHLFIILFFAYTTTQLQQVIPLTYAFDPHTNKKYPIKLSFQQSYTTCPFASSYLPLFNFNLSMELRSSNYDKKEVIIGLKQPSSFMAAVQQTFKVQKHQIQISKSEYTQLVIKDNNFVQTTDQFINEGEYSVKVKYNFGSNKQIDNQICKLVDDSIVYFDQMLILEILNSMDRRNKIQYIRNTQNNVIYLQGELQNFPKIQFVQQKSIFQVQVKGNTLYYLPRSNNSKALSLIGYKALKQFSKFQLSQDKVVFKRTSQLYQLYLYLAYFLFFTLFFLIISRDKLQSSMKFVKSVIQWAVLNNQDARIRVLRTQLQ